MAKSDIGLVYNTLSKFDCERNIFFVSNHTKITTFYTVHEKSACPTVPASVWGMQDEWRS